MAETVIVFITSVKEVPGDMAETVIVFITSVKEVPGDTGRDRCLHHVVKEVLQTVTSSSRR